MLLTPTEYIGLPVLWFVLPILLVVVGRDLQVAVQTTGAFLIGLLLLSAATIPIDALELSLTVKIATGPLNYPNY